MRPQWINSYLTGKKLDFLVPIVYQQLQVKYWNAPLLRPPTSDAPNRFSPNNIGDAIDLRLRLYTYRFPTKPVGHQLRDQHTFHHAPGALDCSSRVDFTKAAQGNGHQEHRA